MAAWVAVDDTDEENGTLMVVPGSHRQDIVCPEESDSSVSFTTHFVPVPESMKEVPVILKAGDVLFFNGSLIHGSYPNVSKDRFRRSFIFHYAPAGCEERSGGYRLFQFDGCEVIRGSAEGGEPCGITEGMSSPH